MNIRPGSYAPFIFSAVALLAFLTLARAFMTALYGRHLDSAGDAAELFLLGLRVDAASISRLYVVPVVFAVLAEFLPAPLRTGVRRVCVLLLSVFVATFVFFEAITPGYLAEYATRPERKFFEYLSSPNETFTMLWQSFRVHVVVGVLAVAASFVFSLSLHARWFRRDFRRDRVFALLILPFVVFAMFVLARSTFDGKPLHPGQVAFTPDILVNNLALNSFFSASYAAYRLLEEVDPASLYGNMPEAEVHEVVNAGHGAATVSAPASPRNLVIILEESLGARFVKSLGGAPLTPRLEEFAELGWWFENLYATGTRSVRGIEAVLSGFLPTPGRSVVRLGDSQSRFFTLAALLREAGYESGFYYGGNADFDNMRGFTLSNGFDYVVDENDLDGGHFRSTYGYCDEDVFAAIDHRLSTQTARPNFILTLTTSNHQPFHFPIETGEQYDEPLFRRENAVRYADQALGRFLHRARKAPYWDDTVFLIVADHDAKVADFMRAGSTGSVFPVEGFHIPALILGAGIEPRRSRYIASQIDLPPTLLSLLKVTGPHPMPGIDLTTVGPQYVGRAIMQHDEYQAHLAGEELLILRPNRPPLAGRYVDRRFAPSANGAPPQAANTALAYALWPGIAYRKQAYFVDYCSSGPPREGCID